MLFLLQRKRREVGLLDLKRVAVVARPRFLEAPAEAPAEVNQAAVVREINVLYKDRFRAEAPML